MYVYHVNECMYMNIYRVCLLYIDVCSYLYVWILTYMDVNINGSVYIAYMHIGISYIREYDDMLYVRICTIKLMIWILT